MNIPTKHSCCTLLIVSMLLIPGLAPAGGLKVFLLAGQSNMVGNCGEDQDPELIALGAPDTNIPIKVFGTATYGWGPLKAGLGSINTVSGPEVAFGHDLANALARQNQVVLIKGAWSGTDLNVRWRPPSSGGMTGDIYTAFVANVRSALAELNVPYELAGVCWLQGESDAGSLFTANAYQTNLINFIADIRHDLNAPKLPFSISKVMPDSTWTYYSIVRAAQQVVADNDPYVGIFDATGLTISGGHYILTACSQIGHNFAANMLSLLRMVPTLKMTIDPVATLPAGFGLIREWNWNTNGNLEGWTANSQLSLAPGTPTSGVVNATATDIDPMWLSPPALNVSPADQTIIEFRVRKDSTDTSRMDLFWADANGGFSGSRLATIPAGQLPLDNQFHVMRLKYSGLITAPLSQLRFDPMSDGPGVGKFIGIDYFRIYAGSGVTNTPPSINDITNRPSLLGTNSEPNVHHW